MGQPRGIGAVNPVKGKAVFVAELDGDRKRNAPGTALILGPGIGADPQSFAHLGRDEVEGLSCHFQPCGQ